MRTKYCPPSQSVCTRQPLTAQGSGLFPSFCVCISPYYPRNHTSCPLVIPLCVTWIKTYPCFTGNSNLPLHHVQGPIGVLGGSSKEALVNQSTYLSTWTSTSTLDSVDTCPQLIRRAPRSVFRLTYGWSLRHCFLSSANRA